MATIKRKAEATDIMRLQQGTVTCYLVGETPLVMNRMAAKAKRELLLPGGRLTTAQKASRPKHNPPEEYRDSAYRMPDAGAPTALAMVATAFKQAMMTAALDMEGVAKTQVGRLCYVLGEYLPVYGVPRLYMAGVRSSDMKRTPDIRTRAILPEWACRVSVKYAMPALTHQAVANLLASGGMCSGVGDGRVEKGHLNFGLFRVASEDDPDYLRIVAAGGREVQEAALAEPVPYDAESAELLAWWEEEIGRRQRQGTLPRAVA